MKTYQIELIQRDRPGSENVFVQVAEDEFILDAIERTGINLPVGCRYGACITCAARLIRGEVEQPNAIALTSKQKAMGYVLLCVAQPQSDCQFEVGTASQAELYINPFQRGIE